MHLTLYGDTAVATGKLMLQGVGARGPGSAHLERGGGAMFRSSLEFTRVYSRQHGEWALVAVHEGLPLAAPVVEEEKGQR